MSADDEARQRDETFDASDRVLRRVIAAGRRPPRSMRSGDARSRSACALDWACALSARQWMRRAERARHHRRGHLVLARAAQARDEAYREAGLPLDRLMVGTGAASVADAVALTRHAAELGFAAALVLPPFYYKGVPDDGLVAYVETHRAGDGRQPDPDLSLSFPRAVRPALACQAGQAAAHDFGARIVGLKDSSGDMAYAREAATVAADFDVFPSTEAVLMEARSRRASPAASPPPPISTPTCARGPGATATRARSTPRWHPQAVRRQAARFRSEGADRAYPSSMRPGRGCSRRSAPFRRRTGGGGGGL